MKMLIYGLITGIAFGFLLQKGRVLRYDKQLGALLFKDMIEYAKELIGGEGKLNPIEIPQFHKTVQVRSMWMLSDKLKSLGYEPKYDLEAIIGDMVQ